MPLKRVFLRSASAFCLSAAMLTGLTSAWADGRPLTITTEQNADYARIVARWADGDQEGPEITARISGPVLILRFEEEVSLDLAELTEGLPGYIAVSRLSDDGREARIALAREYRIHQSESIDRSAIDLVNESRLNDPPDIVSPLVAARAREAELAAERAQSARIAALPPPLDLQVRASEGEDFSTLAFYWPENIDFEARDTADGYQIVFANRAIADLSRTRVDPPRGLLGIEGRNTEETYVVDLDLQTGYWANAVAADQSVLVRFREGSRPDGDLEEDVILPAALAALAVDLPPANYLEPPSRKPLADHPFRTTPEGEVELVPEPDPVPVDPMDVIAEVPVTPRRVWSETLPRSGVVDVDASMSSGVMQLDLNFAANVPSAIFRRNNALWLAFPANGHFDLSGIPQAIGTRVDEVTSESGMALRLFLPRDNLVQITSSGRTWSIEAGGEGVLGVSRIRPTRAANEGGSGIRAVVPDAGTIFSLMDPEVGDELVIVPAFSPAASMMQELTFVEAFFPTTTHGMVVVPRADDLNFVQRGDNILIGRQEGLALSSWGVNSDLDAGQNLTPGFLDFATWRHGDERDYWDNFTAYSHAAAQGDPAEWEGQSALLNFARFLMAWELAAEAYGPLNFARAMDEVLGQDAQWLTLKGAADVMMGRYDEAVQTLDHSAVRSDPAANAWLGMALAERADWRRARQAFLLADPMINAHTPEWAGRFHASAARAMIRMGDGAAAESHALAANRSGDTTAEGQGRLILGELARIDGRPADARSTFTQLLNHESPEVRVRAELQMTRLELAEDRMSYLDAADRLDALRFRWRGDALELEIVGDLAKAYFELGQYREALVLAQNFAMEFPDLPGSRELRIDLMEYFEELFLNGRADRLDPISALALFYEFRDLTPIGPDGDRMIRMLANRLVAFDLLDPATELLAHQVENRNLIGIGRAQIASDLAAIYLLDHRPEAALQTLNGSRVPGLDDELRIQRRLLEAAAHMELQRYGHAIELLEPLDDQRALDLLAEVHWRARTWGAAGRALQRTLPEPGERLSEAQIQTAVRAAVAYRLDGDYDGLANLRAEYGPQMVATSEEDTFDLLTGTNQVSSSLLSDTVRELADTTTADAFLSNLRQRFSNGDDVF
ncbi:hypothetical protein [Ponticaulis sp.]|uniref:tetratricopeptide repeat protein n=1 Tax=Ponticaulis sp. TaxID=2020902 RepID=UPI000B68CFBA|nr:hypothetical protein [Ponticaulis sp.]OUY01706.1 MAG: hypothetical protein CBB65_00905 [Hyphomonadaceae bacterium TMED5]